MSDDAVGSESKTEDVTTENVSNEEITETKPNVDETVTARSPKTISPDTTTPDTKSAPESPETLPPTTSSATPQQEISKEANNDPKPSNIDEISSTSMKSDEDVFKKPIALAETPTTNDEHAKHVTYKADGTAIYTDPKTKYKYTWSEKENNWLPCSVDGGENGPSHENPFENEHYKWCNETQSWKPKATQVTETEHYKWDAEKNEWVAKQATSSITDGESESTTYGLDENGQRTYTDKDGAVYFWDEEKNAWFPKIDDDFMARYQMSYGFIDNTSAAEEEKRKKEEEEAKRKTEELERMAAEARAAMSGESGMVGGKRKATQEPAKWFEIDPEHNTKVYVSNLPLDITLDEFAELMGKCGMIMRDPQTQKFKLKLYTEADGQIKGDGLCDYIKVESVNLALKILDEYVYRGNKIRVQRAKFEMRGAYNPALKPKRKKKDKEKLLKMKERLFDWRPEKMRGERTKNEKIVIIKNLFTPDIFEKDVQLILDYQNDLRDECGKCGTVRKVIIYDCHPEGIAQVNMTSPEEADLVIQMMHGRFFGKRQLSADHWDGKTKYKIAETEKEVEARLSNWDEFLEQEEEKVKEEAKEEEIET